MRILLTGGSSDIGAAIAARRIHAGDALVVTGSSGKSALSSASKIAAGGGEVRGLALDFAKPDEVHAAVLAEIAENGAPDAVVLNAFGRIKPRALHELSFSDARAYVEANLGGNLAVVHACLASFLERKAGRFVLISSVSAAAGTSGYGPYCAAKAGLEGLFLNLAVDYGRHGIAANVVRPGIIATERNRRYWSRGHYQAKMSGIIPSGRFGTPAEVAEAVDYFLSPTCYANGSVLTVSGGLPLISTQGILGL